MQIDKLEKLISNCLLLTNMAIVVVCIMLELSISNRGFDLNDGGWSLLRASYPEAEKADLSRDRFYMGALFKLFEGNVAMLRTSAILILFSSLAIFTKGLFNISPLKKTSQLKPFIVLFSSLVISTLPCFWIERQPCYNILSTSSFFMATGSFMLAVGNNAKFANKQKFNLFLSGFFIALVFLTKFPTVIPTLTVIFLTTYIYVKIENLISIFSFCLLGFIFLITIHLTFFESPQLFYEVTREGWVRNSIMINETFLERIKRQLLDIFASLEVCGGRHKFNFIWIMVSVFVFPRTKLILVLTTIIIVSVTCYIHGELNGGFKLFSDYCRFWFSLGILLYPIILKGLLQRIPTGSTKFRLCSAFCKSLIYMLIFLLFPCFCAIGTANVLTYNANFFASMHVVIFIFLCYKSKILSEFGFCKMQFVLTCLTIPPLICYANSRINSPLFSNDGSSVQDCIHPTRVGNPETILYMSEKQSDLIKRLNEILKEHKFIPGTQILNFTDLPGLVYAVGGKHSVHAWTLNDNDIPYFMQKLNLKEISSSWVFFYRYDKRKGRLNLSFESRGLDIQRTHTLIGSVSNFDVYKPNH